MKLKAPGRTPRRYGHRHLQQPGDGRRHPPGDAGRETSTSISCPISSARSWPSSPSRSGCRSPWPPRSSPPSRLNYSELMFMTFDRESARASGVQVGRLDTLLMVLTAVTIVLGMKVVGILLVAALIVIPAAAGLQVGRELPDGRAHVLGRQRLVGRPRPRLGARRSTSPRRPRSSSSRFSPSAGSPFSSERRGLPLIADALRLP